MGLTKYWESCKISLYNSLVYKADFISNSLFIGLIIFIFVYLWKAVYGSGHGVIEGFTISMMVWYFVMTESIVTAPGRLIEEIGEDVQSGEIATKLNKPYNYVLFKYAYNMGQTLLRFILTFLVGGIIAFLFLGGVEINWLTLPLVGIVIILALTLHFCMMMLLGIFTFWFEDAKALNFLYNKIIFVFGGMLLPLEIFPQWLAKISAVMPFSFVAYHPARLFVIFNLNNFIRTIFLELIWIALFSGLIAIFYKSFIKKISINGG